MKRRSIKERYDAFCKDAEELLTYAGLNDVSTEPRITGWAFYEACVKLATIHFPDDKEVNGEGPRGLIRGMHGAIREGKKDNDVEGALAIAQVLRYIIKHRPPLDTERRRNRKRNSIESRYVDSVGIISQCPFYESKRNYRHKRLSIFVLMPFQEKWSDRLWNDHICKYLNSAFVKDHAEILRADEMFGQGIMEDVYEGIVAAQLIVAECTGRNPNVLYELGIANTLGKRTALLSQNEADIPFDLRRFRFCIYEDNSHGYPKLERFLREVVRETFRQEM